MKIISNRNMFLDGKRVEAGKPTDVSKSEGELALRMGWAVAAEGTPSGNKKPAEGEGGGE